MSDVERVACPIRRTLSTVCRQNSFSLTAGYAPDRTARINLEPETIRRGRASDVSNLHLGWRVTWHERGTEGDPPRPRHPVSATGQFNPHWTRTCIHRLWRNPACVVVAFLMPVSSVLPSR